MSIMIPNHLLVDSKSTTPIPRTHPPTPRRTTYCYCSRTGSPDPRSRTALNKVNSDRRWAAAPPPADRTVRSGRRGACWDGTATS
jgi:hypothetical protein